MFSSGDTDFIAEVKKRFIYPHNKKPKKQIEIQVSFNVNKIGKIDNISIVKGFSVEMDNELIRVLKSMPDWTPGKLDGKPQSFRYNLNFHF
ncbi:MAG: hypothetical protein HC854_12065 [Flavobacterium sp.]|nr:hypothetical protein [Flavobacterium sp.]